MEYVDALIEETHAEQHELSAANLDISRLYEWLDRPITEEDDELNV